MEATVGERSAEAFVEQQEEQRYLGASCCQAIGIPRATSFQEAMGFHLPQVVAQLIEPIPGLGKPKGIENRFVDRTRGPSSDLCAAVEQNFHHPDDARIMDLDPGDPGGADLDRQGDSREEGEIDVDVEPLRLKGSEAICDLQEPLAYIVKMIEAFSQAKVPQVV